jgi:hypothetical protein
MVSDCPRYSNVRVIVRPTYRGLGTPRCQWNGHPHTLLKALLWFWCLDDNSIKGLTSVLSVEQVLSVKLTGFNTSEQM